MAFRIAPKTQFVFYHETTFGTPGTVGKQAPTSRGDLSFWAREQKGETRRRASGYNPQRTGRGFYVADGRLSFVGHRDWIGYMAQKLFGDATITGTADPYTHVWKINNNFGGSVTVEIADQENNKADQINGVKLIGFQFRAAKEASDMEFSVDLLGTGKVLFNQTPLDATPEVFTDPVFPLYPTAVEIDGLNTKLVTEVSFTGRRYASSPAVLNGQRWGEYVILGQWNEVSLDITSVWTSGADDIRNIVTDGAQHSVKVIFSNPSDATHTLEILFPKCDVYTEQVPNIGDDGELSLQVRAYPTDANATEQTAVQLTLKSSVANFATAWTT